MSTPSLDGFENCALTTAPDVDHAEQVIIGVSVNRSAGNVTCSLPLPPDGFTRTLPAAIANGNGRLPLAVSDPSNVRICNWPSPLIYKPATWSPSTSSRRIAAW